MGYKISHEIVFLQIDSERKSYLNNKYVEWQSQNVKKNCWSTSIRDLTVFTVNKVWNKNEKFHQKKIISC